jgi:hypothetical protein
MGSAATAESGAAALICQDGAVPSESPLSKQQRRGMGPELCEAAAVKCQGRGGGSRTMWRLRGGCVRHARRKVTTIIYC